MTGHVFVLRGDLTTLACDAWCVPGGFGPGGAWKSSLPRASHIEMAAAFDAANYHEDGVRAVLWPKAVAPDAPVPFLVNITGQQRGPAWYVDGARQFVDVAAAHLKIGVERRAPLHGRAKHLLALPLVGTGGGGGHVSGEVMRLLLSALKEAAARNDVDVALVLWDDFAYAAAQAERAKDVDPWFRALPAAFAPAADRLAASARSGDLVVFFGAGVSQAAGLPSWSELLADLARERAAATPADIAALASLGELDRAALVQRRLGAQKLGPIVAAHLTARSSRSALPHGLLAGLPVDELVTTNYDDLYERASRAADRDVTVLPSGTTLRGERWLLKMHGCVTRPDGIVLTREDYLRFQENRSALAGIVQALLLTRHMLFVGFSFHDDNFHRIAHAVRDARRQGGAPATTRFGTTLVVAPNPLAEELWKDDVEWLSFAASGDTAAQARDVEIFLDRLGCKAATATGHLGDKRYEALLSDGELEVKALIEALPARASAAAKATPAWREVERLLERLGVKG